MTALDSILPAPVVSWPSVLRDHLSASSLGTFSRCPEQFRRRYLLGHKERPGGALIWGASDHRAHEFNFRQKIDSHEDLPEDDVKLAFAASFDEKVEEEGGTREVEWGSEQPGDLKDKGVELVALYHRLVSPRVQPLTVEEEVSYVAESIPVPIIGRLDIRTESRIVEGKTASRSEKGPKPQWKMQGRLYQAATGKPVEFHVKVKTKTPTVLTPNDEPSLLFALDPVALESTEARIRALVRQLIFFCETFGPDEPWPTGAPDSWANVCGFCGYKPSCYWWASSSRAA